MKRNNYRVILAGILLLGIFSQVIITGCKKKDDTPPLTPEAVSPHGKSSEEDASSPDGSSPHGKMGDETLPSEHPVDMQSISANAKIVVPDEVKKAWSGVKLVVEDKEKSVSKEYNVNIGTELSVEETGLKIMVESFLPDLKIETTQEGPLYTSHSTALENPAAKVVISENGKELFNGWLFSQFPDLYNFKHDRFGVAFKEPVKS